jgi:hypothetical protein
VADAGYGSDENYGILQQKSIEAYIKYNTFDKEQKEGIKAFSNDSLYYNEAENCLTCPMGQRMVHIGDGQRVTSSGYVQLISRTRHKTVIIARCAAYATKIPAAGLSR